MMDDSERLLQQFFSEAASRQIADDGFTERVMQQLTTGRRATEARLRTFSRLWTCFCIVLFAVLFVVFRGWELLTIHFVTMLQSMSAQSFSTSLLMLFAVVYGLLFVGVAEVICREKAGLPLA